MSRNAFVALVNKRAGGNVGSSLLAKFKEELDEGRVYDLSDGGPLRALQEHSQTDNLRIIGKPPFLLSVVQLCCLMVYGSLRRFAIHKFQFVLVTNSKRQKYKSLPDFFPKDETMCVGSS